MPLSADQKFQIADAFTSPAEGGATVDFGGPTNYGVSLRALRAVGYDVDGDGDIDADDIHDLTPELAARFFRVHYFDVQRLGDLPLLVAVAQFDCAVNMGAGAAAKILQATCGFYPGRKIDVDGILGPMTRARVLSICSSRTASLCFAHRLVQRRSARYGDIAASNHDLAQYLHGWRNRCAALGRYLDTISAKEE